MVHKCRTNQAPQYFAIYFMIDLVCQDAALEACHSWIYLIAHYQLVNALSSFVGQKNTTYSQKKFGTSAISQVLKGCSCPLFWKLFLNGFNHIFHDCIQTHVNISCSRWTYFCPIVILLSYICYYCILRKNNPVWRSHNRVYVTCVMLWHLCPHFLANSYC